MPYIFITFRALHGHQCLVLTVFRKFFFLYIENRGTFEILYYFLAWLGVDWGPWYETEEANLNRDVPAPCEDPDNFSAEDDYPESLNQLSDGADNRPQGSPSKVSLVVLVGTLG